MGGQLFLQLGRCGLYLLSAHRDGDVAPVWLLWIGGWFGAFMAQSDEQLHLLAIVATYREAQVGLGERQPLGAAQLVPAGDVLASAAACPRSTAVGAAPSATPRSHDTARAASQVVSAGSRKDHAAPPAVRTDPAITNQLASQSSWPGSMSGN